MNYLRVERYLEKISHLKETLEDLNNWYSEAILHQNPDSRISKREKFAIYHAYQIIVENVTDISAMIVKDSKKMPKDDYSNLEELNNIGIINNNILSELKMANGLRNRVVHEYNGLNDQLALNSIKDHISIFEQFHREVLAWLQQQK